MAEEIDLLIDARWVIPVDGADVLENHSVAVDSGRIKALGPSGELGRKFSAKRHFQLKNHALIPGLVNVHTHGAMSLMRGMADDRPLMQWLKDHIWPAEKNHLSSEFVFDGTLLSCAEMLKGGTTTFNDMYFYPEAVARAAVSAGMRGRIGMVVLDSSTPYASDCDDYLAKGLSARDEFASSPLISFSLAPHAPYTVSDKSFSKILTYAEELDLSIHIHLSETEGEVSESMEKYGASPVARLESIGLLGPNLLAVHMVHPGIRDIEILSKYGCHVGHCPTSNMKLGSGFSPVSKMIGSGINVALGTDGAASNNRSDMFSEMRLSSLIAKGESRQADALPAKEVLEMATLSGAKALGMENEIGSLVSGKLADIAAVDLSNLEISPIYDPLSHLVHCAGREHVSHVWVGGELRVENGNLADFDEKASISKSAWWKDKISGRRNS